MIDTAPIRIKSTLAALLALILFLPFLGMVGITTLGRIIMGTSLTADGVGNFVADHTAFAFFLIFILPAIGVLFLLLYIGADLWRTRSWNPLQVRFLRDHLFAIGTLVLGVLILLFLPAHDTVPCMLHGLYQNGFNNLWQLIAVCRNA